MNLKILLIAILCLSAVSLVSQSTMHEIVLLDSNDNLPIIGATFEYGDQNDISDNAGIIRIKEAKENTLKLSHINYGSWELTNEELKNAITQGVLYRKSLTINIYPVTIIAVRPQDPDKLNFDYQERLEHDGAEILNQVPAFNSIRKGGNYGFDPVFRGFKHDQLNVVLNGAQSATVACPNRMDPPTSQMAPNMMDRIEILKGPHALRFGSGFGATINFIPAKLKFSDTSDIYGRLSSGYESNGNIYRGESRIGLSGDKYDFSLFGSWSEGDDYETGNGEMVQSDFLRGSFGSNLGLKLSNNQQLRLSAMYNRARDADFPALPMDLRNDDTWMFNARHDIQINQEKLQSWNTTVFGSFVDHLMDNLLKPLDPRMMNAETSAKTHNYGARTEGEWLLNKGKMYAGADLKIEGAEGTRIRSFLLGPNAGNSIQDNAWQNGEIRKIGIFGEFHLKSNLFNYVFSGRIESNHADINDPSDEFSQVYPETQINQINPSLSIGVLKNYGEEFKTGLWLGRAQRSGGLTERFINYFPVGQDPYEMLGNPQLNAETNNQLDLTLEWSKERSVIKLDLYASYLQDYISSTIDTSLSPRLPMSPGVRQFINIDKAFKTGFEISWTQLLIGGLQHQMGIAYTYGQDLELDEPLPEIAPLDFRYALSGNYLNNKLRPEVVFRYAMEQSRISNEFGETVSPSFALVDLKIAYAITNKLSLSTGVKNLLNTNYYEHLNRSVRGTTAAIYAPGRNIFGNINLIF